jgi:hypothetical protein
VLLRDEAALIINLKAQLEKHNAIKFPKFKKVLNRFVGDPINAKTQSILACVFRFLSSEWKDELDIKVNKHIEVFIPLNLELISSFLASVDAFWDFPF